MGRLISVVEEQALTLLRTAFSTSVRESGDLSGGVFDPRSHPQKAIRVSLFSAPSHVVSVPFVAQ